MYRNANRKDLPEFLQLWTEFAEELAHFGGDFGTDEDSLRDVRNLFQAYVWGTLDGVVVLYEPPGDTPQGFVFVGESGGPPVIGSRNGKRVANGWALYIRPDHRERHIAIGLQKNIKSKLRKMNFDTVSRVVLAGNEGGTAAALGCTLAGGNTTHHGTIYHTDLEAMVDGQ